MGFLARMQKLPNDEKRVVALIIAGVFTLIIAVSWYFFHYTSGIDFSSPIDAKDTQQLQQMFSEFGSQINQANNNLASATAALNATTSQTATTTISSTTDLLLQ